ncbi:hypothetical protein VB779_09320 [Haloarculaceae archaeon H-GB11]|nr:hypothetical protein [Haloarculaceae archaeon H-GB11]
MGKGDNYVNFYNNGGGPAAQWEITWTENTATEDPAIDIDGDGTDDASYSGVLLSGETSTESVSDLSPGSHTAEMSTARHQADVELAITERTGTEDPSIDVDGDGYAETSYSGVLHDGFSTTEPIDSGSLSAGSNTIIVNESAGQPVEYLIEATEVSHTEDPFVDVDGDGTYEVQHAGVVSPGSTKTYDVSELTLTSSSLDVQTDSGSAVEVATTYRERTESNEIDVTVNGNTTSYAGTLADGEQQSLTTDVAWVQEGPNDVTVNVGGDLAADAPNPQVDVEYRHEALDKQSVTFVSETWTERYNVSKTYADAATNATLTIPFAGSVVSVRDVETRVNGERGRPWMLTHASSTGRRSSHSWATSPKAIPSRSALTARR